MFVQNSRKGLSDYFKSHIHQEGIIVSEKKKFIYMKPTKTAGTTILRHIIGKQIDDVFELQDQPEKFNSWLNGIKDHTLDEYFIFTFVRNPWDRMISITSHFGLSLKDYLNKIEEYKKDPDIFVHSLPQHIYSHFDNHCFVDFIGRFECLQEDFNLVCDKIGLDRVALPVTNRSLHKKYTKYYTELEINKVNELYDLDIEYYGYMFPRKQQVSKDSTKFKMLKRKIRRRMNNQK